MNDFPVINIESFAARNFQFTRIQTKKMEPIPVIMFGRDYWDNLVNWEMFVEEGTIAPEDLNRH